METAETEQFRRSPKLDVNSGNEFENFKRWKRLAEVYLAASGASEKDDKIQTAIILNCEGPHVVEVNDNFVWSSDADKVLEALEKYCNPRDNEVIESHRFWNIPYQEPFAKYLSELKTRAAARNFQEKDRMLRDKIVFTMTGKLQEFLLRLDSLTLDKAVKIGRAFEQTNRQVREFRENMTLSNSSTKVKKITIKPDTKALSGKKTPKVIKSSNKHGEKLKFDCKFCGYKHKKQKDNCPTWGKTCDTWGESQSLQV